MRPLYHPSIKEMSVQGVLYALSDPVRVRIFVGLMNADCAKSCSAFLNMDRKRVPKSSLSQHFKVLREAGLIRSEKIGVELHNTIRWAEVEKRFGSMVEVVIRAYVNEAKKR